MPDGRCGFRMPRAMDYGLKKTEDRRGYPIPDVRYGFRMPRAVDRRLWSGGEKE